MSVAGQTGISKHPPTCAGMLQQTTRSMNTDLEKLSSKQRTRIRSAADIPADACSVSVSLEGAIVQLMKDEAGRSEGPWREAPCGAVSFQDARKELDRELAFFRKNQRRMRAPPSRARLWASHKVLAALPVKHSGIHWQIHSGKAVLSFRMPQKSGLFDRTGSDLMAARDAAANENHPCLTAQLPRDGLHFESRT